MNVQYPIGPYEAPAEVTQEQIEVWIDQLVRLPNEVEQFVGALTGDKLDMRYRTDGWTLRQVLHHIADAEMQSYVHFKLALTEDNPTIKPYMEELWAEQADEKQTGPELSLPLLRAVVGRWERLLRSMTPADWHRTFVHPFTGTKRLDQYLGFCVWHGYHHLAQMKSPSDIY